MKNFGLIGKMGSGKTTAAEVLRNTHGYVPVSFAAPLKEMVIEADPLIEYRCWSQHGAPTNPVPVHLSDILKYSGKTFEEAKREYPEVRRSLQRIGQGVRRIDPEYWVKALLTRLAELPAGTPVVVPDVRYPNEADALRTIGYTLVRVTRPTPQGMTMDETRASMHDSEWSLDDYEADVTINNDGTLIDFVGAVLDLV